jgi:hypothetical protein
MGRLARGARRFRGCLEDVGATGLEADVEASPPRARRFISRRPASSGLNVPRPLLLILRLADLHTRKSVTSNKRAMQAALQLPADFQKSCLNSKSYPENLSHRSTNIYPTALKAYRRRLDSAQSDLFVESEADVEVPFRDFQNASGQGTYQLGLFI